MAHMGMICIGMAYIESTVSDTRADESAPLGIRGALACVCSVRARARRCNARGTVRCRRRRRHSRRWHGTVGDAEIPAVGVTVVDGMASNDAAQHGTAWHGTALHSVTQRNISVMATY